MVNDYEFSQLICEKVLQRAANNGYGREKAKNTLAYYEGYALYECKYSAIEAVKVAVECLNEDLAEFEKENAET